MGILAIILVISIIKSKNQKLPKIEQISNINTIIKVQIILCFIMGAVLVFFIGIFTLYLFIIWSVITGVIYFIYITKGKRFVGNF